jgi:putative polyhydroxyalkanoate system protein
MPRIKMETEHSLGKEEAARRLKEKFGDVQEKYGSQVNNLKEKWVGHTFSFDFSTMGMAVRGGVEVCEKLVKLDVEIPLVAMIFKGTIENRIREEFGSLLS